MEREIKKERAIREMEKNIDNIQIGERDKERGRANEREEKNKKEEKRKLRNIA